MPFARVLLFLLLAVAAALFAAATPVVDAPQLAAAFEKRRAEGCFVAYDPRGDQLLVYNHERASRRLLPASTFKIANALIGLELGAVSDVEEVVPYGDTKEYFPSWEQDMNLRDAMAASNVAVFHQLAKRIGLERMRQRLDAYDYGNEAVGDAIERRFWLSGPLAISALEQVDFLRRLTAGALPVEPKQVAALRSILQYEEAQGYTLFGKSGWGGPQHPETGWWVGWIERDGQRIPFAVNVDVPDLPAAQRRLPIALECLEALGLLPPAAD